MKEYGLNNQIFKESATRTTNNTTVNQDPPQENDRNNQVIQESATGTTNYTTVSQDPPQENDRNNQVIQKVCFIQNYLDKHCDYFIYKLYCFLLIGGNVSMLIQLIMISNHQI